MGEKNFLWEFVDTLATFGLEGDVIGRRFAIKVKPLDPGFDHQDIVGGTITGLAITDCTVKLETSVANLCPRHRLVCILVHKDRGDLTRFEAIYESVREGLSGPTNSALAELTLFK